MSVTTEGSASSGSSSGSTSYTGKALDNVRLRSGPSTSYTTLATVPKGTTVKVVDNSNKGWVKVTYSGLTAVSYTHLFQEGPTAFPGKEKLLWAAVRLCRRNDNSAENHQGIWA